MLPSSSSSSSSSETSHPLRRFHDLISDLGNLSAEKSRHMRAALSARLSDSDGFEEEQWGFDSAYAGTLYDLLFGGCGVWA
ncbi:hypothetical protein BAUCODRAFT_337341 [Baudoinia panamericana UAMH 10762]|uniref:Uncharacterized protein n=1 Tax=Baudoinia panamericana (strain UAMH 10762) TaxID=717646 RepID=M2LXP2_BAUPA|nr:uncharacterized protein BAUCODRAFT_337341 [Baudoinia panamericana UAMH 10762]EMC99457.1 hypothetical protein BAUCODRAFT_337341 [Baudoinia panamericana UAMH 10762]